eukprot:6429099-Amphidinium_carterae.1
MDQRLRSNPSDCLEAMDGGFASRSPFCSGSISRLLLTFLRLVLDCRMVNVLFSHAPYTELVAAHAFTGIELQLTWAAAFHSQRGRRGVLLTAASSEWLLGCFALPRLVYMKLRGLVS